MSPIDVMGSAPTHVSTAALMRANENRMASSRRCIRVEGSRVSRDGFQKVDGALSEGWANHEVPVRYSRYQVVKGATFGGYRPGVASWCWGVEETAMRKVLVALVAIGTIAVAGVLVAAPKSKNNGHQAFVITGVDIFSITQSARHL